MFESQLKHTHGGNTSLVWGEVNNGTVELLNLDVEVLDDNIEGLDVLVVGSSLNSGSLELVSEFVYLSLELALFLVNPDV